MFELVVRTAVTRGVFYSASSLVEVILRSVDLAERADFRILAWFFLQDGLQRSLTGSMDFTGGDWKFLYSLRALFGLIEEKPSIGASSSYRLIISAKDIIMMISDYLGIYTPPGPPSSCEVPRLVRAEHSRDSSGTCCLIYLHK